LIWFSEIGKSCISDYIAAQRAYWIFEEFKKVLVHRIMLANVNNDQYLKKSGVVEELMLESSSSKL